VVTRPRMSRAAGTISWGLLDQAVASAATFVFVVFAARNLGAPEVGAIAFTFELYLLAVFITRGVAGDPLTSRYSGADPSTLRRQTGRAATTAVLSGVSVGGLMAIGAAFAPHPLRDVLLVAAIAMPALALQEFVRAALIVQGRVRATFVNDALWAVGQLPAMYFAVHVHPTAPSVIGAWAATGAVAALVGLVQLRQLPASPRAVRFWLNDTRDLWPYYLADNMLFQASSLVLVAVVSATAGLPALAGFRVAMTVYAPLSMIGRGVISVAVAMLARRRNDPQGVRQRAMSISATLTPMAIVWGLLTLLIPTSAGQELFGESWTEAEPVVFLASFVCASGLFAAGTTIGLRALSAGRHTFVGRVVVSIGAAVAASIGGYLDGGYGLFLGLAIFFPVQVVVWWSLLRHAANSATPVSEP